jgi:hypothetical protein
MQVSCVPLEVVATHSIGYTALIVDAGSARRKELFVQQTITRRSFVTALGMFILPLTALAQDKREEKKKEAQNRKEDAKDKKEDAKDKAKDAVEDHDKVVDGPGTDRSQERRQDRRRDAVKK